MKYKISSKYCFYNNEIVEMYFINNVPFTFEELPQIIQDDPYIQIDASNNEEYSPEDLYKTSFYLIDEECIVFHESVNHMSLGRDINEYLRLIDAYTHVQNVGEVCPANWKNGAQAIKADIDSLSDYLKNI